MRMRSIILCSVVLFGGFVISSSSSSSNIDLFVAFLSYDDNRQNGAGDENACGGGQCQILFDVALRGRNGVATGARQSLATALFTQGMNTAGLGYVDINDIAKPVWFDVGDQLRPVEFRLYVRIYRNGTKGDPTAADGSSGQTLDEIIYVLNFGNEKSSNFFNKLVIRGIRRPNARLHLAVRFSCKGGDCADDCVDEPWQQRCKDSVARRNSSKEKYGENPLARCPNPPVIHPTRPTSLTTSIATTTDEIVQPSLPVNTSSSFTPSSSTQFTPTSLTNTRTASLEQSSSSATSSSITDSSLSPSITESSVSISPTMSSSYTTNTKSPISGSGTSRPRIETSTQTTDQQTQTLTGNPSTMSTTPSLQTGTASLEQSISTIPSYQTELSPIQSVSESSTNQMQPTSLDISPTTTRRSCKCTKSTSSKSGMSSNTYIQSLTVSTQTLSSPMPSLLSHSSSSLPSSSPSQTVRQTHPSTNIQHPTSANISPTPSITTLQKSTEITTGTTSTTTITITNTNTTTTSSPIHSLAHVSSSPTTQGISSSSTPVTPTTHDNTKSHTSGPQPISTDGSPSHKTPASPTSPRTTQPPFLPVESSENDDDAMAYWAIIVGSVLGGLALVGIIGYFLYRSRQTSLRKRQELYTVTPQMISTIEDNGTAGRSDVPMTTALL